MPNPPDLRRDPADPDPRPSAATPTPAGPVADYDPARPVFAVPYPGPGDGPVAREAALEQVRQRLASGPRAAIVPGAGLAGRGGLGTTRLAVEYAYRARDLYPNGVLWLAADRDLDGQLAELAVAARWVAPESEHRFKLEIARHRLRSVGDCLIVFDGVADPAAIGDYLPEPPPPSPASPQPASPAVAARVLVVGRAGPPDFAAVPIDLLDPDAALGMLIQASGRAPQGDAERAAAAAVARALEGLPLALELAGAYLSQQGMGYGDYLALLGPAIAQASRQPPPTGPAGPAPLDTQLHATLLIGAGVVARTPLLQAVLDALAWSGPAPMGTDLLAALVGVADGAELAPALALGSALGLLRQVPGAARYALPAPVRGLRRLEVPIDARPDWAAEVCERVATWFGALLGDLPRWPHFESELDHLGAWHDHAVSLAPGQAARLTWLRIYAPLQRGQPQEMRRLAELGLDEYRDHGCDDRSLLANLYNDLAFGLDGLGESGRALDLAEQALAIRRGLFGDRHPDTARSLGNVANYRGALGDDERALELALQAFGMRRELFGDRHRDSAASLANVATYRYNLGRPSQALEAAEEVLAIRRGLYGDRHPDTAAALDNVAFYANAIGQSQRALGLAEETLAMRLAMLGQRHPDTAISLNAVANYTSALGNHQRALELAQQALAIQHTLFGLRHPATAKCLHNAAGYSLKLGKTNEAHTQAQAAYDLFRQLLGTNHPQTLSTAKLLGSIKRPGFRIPSFKKKGGGGKSGKPRK